MFERLFLKSEMRDCLCNCFFHKSWNFLLCSMLHYDWWSSMQQKGYEQWRWEMAMWEVWSVCWWLWLQVYSSVSDTGPYWQEELIPFFQSAALPKERTTVQQGYLELSKQVKAKFGKVDPHFLKLGDTLIAWIWCLGWAQPICRRFFDLTKPTALPSMRSCLEDKSWSVKILGTVLILKLQAWKHFTTRKQMLKPEILWQDRL